MSHFLDRLSFLHPGQPALAMATVMTTEDRSWEDGYRKRWQHDKIVRSTHGVNCTGSCSWKVYVKGGIVTGVPSRPIIRAHARICPIMSRVVLRARCEL